ncbi:6-phosphogluconolactonase [Novosphingopyxis sp.]|uniref:6-phosphogluconolactonase n=1 Tax=Novosphingopyxis sp. TaxID=2709690 RepID=UPI003B595171
MIERKSFETVEQLREKVALDVTKIIREALLERGQALLALSGGSSPFPIYEKLSHSNIGWGKVSIIPADDRIVEEDSELSNIAALRRVFGDTGASIMPLFETAGNEAQAAVEARGIADKLNFPIELIWLGMGADGHFASVFPGPDYDKAFNPPAGAKAVRVRPDPLPPEAPVSRISLSVPCISNARNIVLVIAGADKRAVLTRAIEEGEASGLPIARFLAQLERNVTVYEGP